MKSNSRYLGALMIAPFIIFVFLGGVYLKTFTFALSIMAMWEFYRALEQKEMHPVSIIGYLLIIAYYLLNNNIESTMYLIILAVFILLMVPVINLKYTFIDAALKIGRAHV